MNNEDPEWAIAPCDTAGHHPLALSTLNASSSPIKECRLAMPQRLAECRDHSSSQPPPRAWTCILSVALLGLCVLAAPAEAQDEEPEPTRYQGVTWNQVLLVDFKSGKEERAMEIIEDRLLPVVKKAGNQIPRTVEMQTGPWDLLLVWTLKDGPSDMTWEISPEEIETMKAAQEMFGQEKMETISDEYSSLIARSTSFLGFSGRHGAPITAQMPE